MKSSEAGFTLIEMLVVLSILALTASVAMPLLSKGSEGVQLESAASELAAALRTTRTAAMTVNRPVALMVDVEHRTFGSSAVPLRSFAPGIDAKLTFAAVVRTAAFEGGFKFFPDGSSTGGEITLSLHERKQKLCIDWLTGIVRKVAVCDI